MTGRLTKSSAILAFVVLGAGCVNTTYVPTTHYAVIPDVSVETAPSTGVTLAIRELEYAAPYKQAIVFRDDPYVVRYHDNAQWSEMPRDTVTRSLIDALARSAAFADVGNAHDMSRANLTLTGELRRFDEMRNGDSPTALCELRLEIRQGLETEVVWAQTLRASVPLESDSREHLARAMSAAVTEVLEQAVPQIVESAAKSAQ